MNNPSSLDMFMLQMQYPRDTQVCTWLNIQTLRPPDETLNARLAMKWMGEEIERSVSVSCVTDIKTRKAN